MIKEYTIEERFRRQPGHGSLGMTNKFYKDGYWYKQNKKGYEGKSEWLCSTILKHSNIKHYVAYEECRINGVAGCRSQNFLKPGESLTTFSRLYDTTCGGDLKYRINAYSRFDDRIQYVLDFIYECTGLDVYDYLGKALKFDMLTYDVDRHFSNLAVIRTGSGYREAPLFDFGASFFSMQHIFTPDMTLEEKIAKMTPQPFSAGFEEQAAFFEKVSLCLDYQKIQAALSSVSDEIKEMVLYSLEQHRKYFKTFDSSKTPYQE